MTQKTLWVVIDPRDHDRPAHDAEGQPKQDRDDHGELHAAEKVRPGQHRGDVPQAPADAEEPAGPLRRVPALQFGEGIAAPADLFGQAGADEHVQQERQEGRPREQELEIERLQAVGQEGQCEADGRQQQGQQHNDGDPPGADTDEGDPPPQVCQASTTTDQGRHDDARHGGAEGEREGEQVRRQAWMRFAPEQSEEVSGVGLIGQCDAFPAGEEVRGKLGGPGDGVRQHEEHGHLVSCYPFATHPTPPWRRSEK